MAVSNSHTVDGSLLELRVCYAKLQQLAAAVGIAFAVADYGGLRDRLTTQQLIAWRDADVAAGHPWYAVAPFGESYHDYGAAFDARIIGGPASAIDVLGSLAPQAGLRWGGTWPEPNTDRPHFELPITLAEAHILWLEHLDLQLRQATAPPSPPPQPPSSDV